MYWSITMTTIEDSKLKSISEMQTDEAIELLRQLRLSRRIPKKKQSKATVKKKAKAKAIPKLNAEQAKELLKLLGG